MRKYLANIDTSLIDELFRNPPPGSINLALGQPDFGTPDLAKEKGIKSIQDGHTRYTPAEGVPELRDAVARMYNGLGLNYTKDNIMISVGSTEATMAAVLALTNEGDEVILSDPYFPLYTNQILIAGAIPVYIPLNLENDFRVTPEAIEKAVTPKTRIIILNSPHNPTGSVTTKEDIEGIAEIAKANNIIVVSDEIYRKFIYDGKVHHSIGRYLDRVILVDGVSKEHDMTGWRIGWAVSNPDILRELSKVHQAMVTCPPSPNQYAALEAVRRGNDRLPQVLAEYQRRRDFLLQGLREIGLMCNTPSGAFYVFPRISDYGSSLEVSERLKENGVLVAPGIIFGQSGEGYIRMTYSTVSIDILAQALCRISNSLRNNL